MQKNEQTDLITLPPRKKSDPFIFPNVTLIRWSRQEKKQLYRLFQPGELEAPGRKKVSTRIKRILFSNLPE